MQPSPELFSDVWGDRVGIKPVVDRQQQDYYTPYAHMQSYGDAMLLLCSSVTHGESKQAILCHVTIRSM